MGVVIGEQRLANFARPIPEACEDPLKALGECNGLTGLLGGGLFARPLDELSGSVSSSTDGMRGRFSLTLD